MSVVIKVEDLYKQYKLGEISTGSIVHDLNRWWHKARGKNDPYQLVTGENAREYKSDMQYVWALQNINFEVKQGEVLGIVGRNGAGKSTLLKILSKVTGPTRGQIKIDGRIASLLEVGTGFHPELSGRENIFLNGAILGMTKQEIRSKFDEIVAFSGVEQYIDTPVKRYSSGMYVRLAFAVAAHLEPEILIVDEVLAVGDAEFQKKCLGKMKDVAGQGRTVLFVSHNMAAVRTLCDKGILIDKGKILYEGDTSDVLHRYYTLINKSESETVLRRVENNMADISNISFHASLHSEPASFFQSGEDIYVRIELNFRVPIMDELKLFVGLDNSAGVRVTNINNELINKVIHAPNNLDNTLVVTFQLNRNNLISDNYSCSILLQAGDQIVDWLENVPGFDIKENLFYPTGKNIIYKNETAIVYSDYQIHLNQL